MKAAYIEATGPAADVIRVGEFPTPEAGPGQVLLRVGAASVNPIDTYMRSGAVPISTPLPYVVGCDVAGTVEAFGPGVRNFKVGDRVWGANQGQAGRQGTFAEYAAIDEQWLYPTPANVSDEAAAALALVGLTAYVGLIRDGRPAAGDVVFVSGGTGGVGSAVVQMARAAGARVVTTAGSEAKADQARALGADHVMLYKQQDLAEGVRAAAPEGIAVWYETLATPDFERTLPLLAKGGRMIVMAGRKTVVPLPIGPLYTGDKKILGVSLFNATPEEQRAAAEAMNRWMAEGRLRANISHTFALEETAAAHQLQEDNTLHKAGTLAGKIVIKP